MPGMEVDFDKSIIEHSTVMSNVTCTGVENNIAQCVYTVTQTITCELATVTCVDMTTQMPTSKSKTCKYFPSKEHKYTLCAIFIFASNIKKVKSANGLYFY